MNTTFLVIISSIFSPAPTTCGQIGPAFCIETPNIEINIYFDQAEQMASRLKCECNKNNKHSDLDCTKENLDKVDQLYQKAISSDLTQQQLLIIYSHYSYFLLWYRDNVKEAKNYSDKALALNKNDEVALFVNVQCDCSQPSINPPYANIIERIEMLDQENRVVPLMYYCLFSAYIETSQVCKAEALIEAGKFKNQPFWAKLFLRWDLRDEKKRSNIKKCH